MKKLLIILGMVVIMGGGLLLLGLGYWVRSSLGGGGSHHYAPETVLAGESADVTLIVTATGGGGKIQGRFTNISLHFRLAGENAYRPLRPQPVILPDNFKTVQSKTFQSEAYTFTIPPYPKGTTGEIEYYTEMIFDGHLSRKDGLIKIKIIDQSEQSVNVSEVSLSMDKKSISINSKVVLSIDDDTILTFFITKSELCDTSNISGQAGRKMFCEDKMAFKEKTSFKSIVVSQDGKKIGFTIESDALSPDTVVGIFYPQRTISKISFLSNYYLGNEFLSFSPSGSNFVYRSGCFEAKCAFYIKDSETLKDKINFIPLEADARGNYEFVKWISDDEIEYKLDKGIKRLDIFQK